jgi:hypothetical protein
MTSVSLYVKNGYETKAESRAKPLIRRFSDRKGKMDDFVYE